MTIFVRLLRIPRWDWQLTALTAIAVLMIAPLTVFSDRCGVEIQRTGAGSPEIASAVLAGDKGMAECNESEGGSRLQSLYDSPVDTVVMIISRTVYRVVMGSHAGAQFAAHIFGQSMPYQYGATWFQDLSALMPGPNAVYSVTYAELLGESWGSVTMGFPGETYANFGYFGVGVGFFILGLIVMAVDKILRPEDGTATPLRLAIYAFIAAGLVRIFYGSTFNILVLHLMPIAFIMGQLLVIRMLQSIFRKKRY